MRAPAFWSAPRPSLAARALAPIGAIVGGVTARRMRETGVRAALPVVCVGNFTVGGTGKTPVALALADLLAGAGERPVFLSRGHGARVAQPTRVHPDTHGAAEVGDEPLLLARVRPTIVSPDRPAGAALAAATSGASVIVMDDGLQNPSLLKDCTIAVVDGETGIGNGLCLPAGPLRAPLAGQLGHVHAVVTMGDGPGGAAVASAARARGLPVFAALLAPDEAAAAQLAGARVLAFAGIGRPEKLFATLRAIGAEVVEAVPLPDHHAYAPGEAQALVERARAAGLLAVTTTKDAVKTGPIAGLAVLPVAARFANASGLLALVMRRIEAARRAGEPGA
ncbi:tetraacyldisaccharide 4'-kinase [Salinarimonas sp.]|uniref:tetraacyldisaccharide 4'-kinase n=1 Tax=Salinarimonas sp. TaxID=2766526 RepID=UPI003919EEC9